MIPVLSIASLLMFASGGALLNLLWGDYEVASVSKAKFSGSGWELEPAERESDR